MNLFTKYKQTYRYQNQTYSCQRGNVGEEGIKLEKNMHTLLYVNIRYTTNRDLLTAQGTLPNTL